MKRPNKNDREDHTAEVAAVHLASLAWSVDFVNVLASTQMRSPELHSSLREAIGLHYKSFMHLLPLPNLRVSWFTPLNVALLSFFLASMLPARAANAPLRLTLRSQVASPENTNTFTVAEKKATWDPKKTALIVCDMWDDHWCKSAARRVGELAGPLNDVVKTARSKGVLIIHAPSSVTKFYEGTAQRKLAQTAPFTPSKVPLSTNERWGTAWCWPDPKRERDLPIDDSDMGCDCRDKCTIREAWTRQISTIEIAPTDAITDNGQETWNLLQQRGIENVILTGVHLNMCVLGRPFGIRQMVNVGKNVALMRDMTDTMYNPEKRPMVNHFAGTDLVIAHVEKYWCPSFTSSDITGQPAFRFKDDKR